MREIKFRAWDEVSNAKVNGWKNAGTKLFRAKQKKDAYGSDSPMIADIARMRSVVLRWITQDATDKEYPYKLTDEDFAHLVRDCIAIAPRLLSNRIPPQTNRKTLQVYFQSIKPAKKAGQKVKSANKLKGAKTAN